MSNRTGLSSAGSKNCAGVAAFASSTKSSGSPARERLFSGKDGVVEASAAVTQTVTHMDPASKAQRELQNIEREIERLEAAAGDNKEAQRQLHRLHSQVEALRHQLYSHLTAFQKTEMARHPQRPYTLDYAERVFRDWTELHGDRGFSDDPAIVCGFGRFHGDEV